MIFLQNIEETPDVRKCQKPRCATCPYLQEGHQFEFKNGRNFNIHSSITCESSHLIYVITCAGCGENYIGQTGDTLRHRMTVHRQQIRETKYQCTAVSGHLRNCQEHFSELYSVSYL